MAQRVQTAVEDCLQPANIKNGWVEWVQGTWATHKGIFINSHKHKGVLISTPSHR